MTQRYDVGVWVEGKEDKSFFRRVGSMWPHKEGGGFNIELDFAVGEKKLSAFVPKPKDVGSATQNPAPLGGEIDDKIPF